MLRSLELPLTRSLQTNEPLASDIGGLALTEGALCQRSAIHDDLLNAAHNDADIDATRL